MAKMASLATARAYLCELAPRNRFVRIAVRRRRHRDDEGIEVGPKVICVGALILPSCASAFTARRCLRMGRCCIALLTLGLVIVTLRFRA